MGKMQRNKGARGERELVNKWKETGRKAKRISMMETGRIDKGDVVIADEFIGEVKVGKQVPKFIYDAVKTDDNVFLFVKRDRHKWKVIMDLEWFMKRWFR